MNIPNWLTLMRILLIPFFVIVFYLPFSHANTVSAIIFAIACATDWLDGYLARSLKQVSALGRFLDPVADKLIVAVALVLLVGEKNLSYLAIPAAVIVGREIVVSALREWMAEIGDRTSVAVSHVGKVKTFIQMLSILFLLLYKPGGSLIIGVSGYVLLYVAAALTLWSMLVYLRIAWPNMTK